MGFHSLLLQMSYCRFFQFNQITDSASDNVSIIWFSAVTISYFSARMVHNISLLSSSSSMISSFRFPVVILDFTISSNSFHLVSDSAFTECTSAISFIFSSLFFEETRFIFTTTSHCVTYCLIVRSIFSASSGFDKCSFMPAL